MLIITYLTALYRLPNLFSTNIASLKGLGAKGNVLIFQHFICMNNRIRIDFQKAKINKPSTFKMNRFKGLCLTWNAS